MFRSSTVCGFVLACVSCGGFFFVGLNPSALSWHLAENPDVGQAVVSTAVQSGWVAAVLFVSWLYFSWKTVRLAEQDWAEHRIIEAHRSGADGREV